MTISINDVRRTVYRKLLGEPDGTESAIDGLLIRDIALDNEFFEPPFPAAEGNKQWVRFTVRHQTRMEYSFGERKRFRQDGAIFCQVFIQTDEASRKSDMLAQSIADLFDSETISIFSERTITATAMSNLNVSVLRPLIVNLTLEDGEFVAPPALTSDAVSVVGITDEFNNLPEVVGLGRNPDNHKQSTVEIIYNGRLDDTLRTLTLTLTVHAHAIMGSDDDISTRLRLMSPTAKQLVDSTASGRLHFDAANIRESGVSGDWFMYIVEIPFHYYTRT